nr:CI [Donkey orchid virus A]
SLDDVLTDTERNLTISFDLESHTSEESQLFDTRFDGWWENQLVNNRTIPNHRLSGLLVDFTRENAAQVATKISKGLYNTKEFIIRGAVGSGKSTGLPAYLCQSGSILILEPTRPLAENVYQQLGRAPFNIDATLRMRGRSVFGSRPVTVMTTGFALHLVANNICMFDKFDYIMFDECHVMDANAMAFYCLLKDCKYDGVVLKVSATPPGRECEFKTQHEVSIAKEDRLTFDQFVLAQGTGANADVTNRGNTILVYVASYKEVDTLSSKLLCKGYLVTKVDGRTMKVGSTNIDSKGTDVQKHFIVATNIIENGVTLDIDVVVDFGQKIVGELDTDGRCLNYVRRPVSYGERIQRLGRVGRFKPGHVLRIGHTETGIQEVSALVATEAAFYCFVYGLPVMTHNVTTGFLGRCTTEQARTMLQFEIDINYMYELVRHDGMMHPAIHDYLKKYKLRDSETRLSELAMPTWATSKWKKASEYVKLGCHVSCNGDTKIPFLVNGISDKMHEDIWDLVKLYQKSNCFKPIKSACAAKIAYTLQTDWTSIGRSIGVIDQLIADEMTKRAHFESMRASTVGPGSFTLQSIVNLIKTRNMVDHSADNIRKLQSARNHLLEFESRHIDARDPNELEAIMECPAVATVLHE